MEENKVSIKKQLPELLGELFYWRRAESVTPYDFDNDDMMSVFHAWWHDVQPMVALRNINKYLNDGFAVSENSSS